MPFGVGFEFDIESFRQVSQSRQGLDLVFPVPQILDRLSSQGLPNPRPNTPEVRDEGAWLYDVYCAICHGATGQGNGKIAEHYRRMPNLSLPQIQAYTDGWIYSIIREGGFNMPASAESLSVDERWALVHFLRTFQTSE